MGRFMSVVDDFRKVLQDFLAPELRAISARLDAIEKVAEARHSELLTRIATVMALLESLKSSFELDKRIERLETKQPRA